VVPKLLAELLLELGLLVLLELVAFALTLVALAGLLAAGLSAFKIVGIV
jgi:hypothetical protein